MESASTLLESTTLAAVAGFREATALTLLRASAFTATLGVATAWMEAVMAAMAASVRRDVPADAAEEARALESCGRVWRNGRASRYSWSEARVLRGVSVLLSSQRISTCAPGSRGEGGRSSTATGFHPRSKWRRTLSTPGGSSLSPPRFFFPPSLRSSSLSFGPVLIHRSGWGRRGEDGSPERHEQSQGVLPLHGSRERTPIEGGMPGNPTPLTDAFPMLPSRTIEEPAPPLLFGVRHRIQWDATVVDQGRPDRGRASNLHPYLHNGHRRSRWDPWPSPVPAWTLREHRGVGRGEREGKEVSQATAERLLEGKWPRISHVWERTPPPTVRTNAMPWRKGSPVHARPYNCWVIHDPVSAIFPIRSTSSPTLKRVAEECTEPPPGRKWYGPIQLAHR